MTGRELYEIHVATAQAFQGRSDERLSLQPWEALDAGVQASWERHALEQTERDLEEVGFQ